MLMLSFAAACHQDGSGPRAQPSVEKAELVETTWPDGKPRLRKQVLRQPDGTLLDHGIFMTWYANGQKEFEGVYVRGELEGVATSWHRNGQKWVEERHVHGRRHGARFSWDEKGVLRKEEHYVDDKPDGTWTAWDAQGRIKAQQHFDRGVPKDPS
jgi:hypothetical protein